MNEDAPDAFQDLARMSALATMVRSVRDGSANTVKLGRVTSSTGESFSLLRLVLKKYLQLFINCTENNSSVEEVLLDIEDLEILDDAGDPVSELEYYRRWTQLAQGLSNLKGLKKLKITSIEMLEGDGEDIPDYRALEIVLRAVPQMKNLEIDCSLQGGNPHIIQAADALRNHPNLNRVCFQQRVDTEALDRIAHQLVTVKALSEIDFGFLVLTRRILPDSFFVLLGMESLTSLKLHRCNLSEVQCRVMAEQLSTLVSKMNLIDLSHSRTEGLGATHILTSLREHKHIKTLQFTLANLNESACAMLGELIAANQSVEEMNLIGETFIDRDRGDDPGPGHDFDTEWLAPLFGNLQRNRALKKMLIHTGAWSDQLVDSFGAFLQCPTCQLADLRLNASAFPPGWPRLLPSLEINRSLKKLTVTGGLDRQGAIDIASHISRNTSIEDLHVEPVVYSDGGGSMDDSEEEDEAHPANYPEARFVEALGHNITVKALAIRFDPRFRRFSRSEEGLKQMEEALRSNYGISSMRGACSYRDSIVPAILTLNKVDRKYLIEDPSNKVRALQVLAEVSECLDALFFHLSENPSLCGGNLN